MEQKTNFTCDKDNQNYTINDNQSEINYSISFTGTHQNFCVGIITLEKPKRYTDFLTRAKHSQIFLNSIAKILIQFGGFIVKNRDDFMLYYFPQSAKNNKKYGFISCLESCNELLEERQRISQSSEKLGLPPINFRISIDFGQTAVMQSSFSFCPDLLGPTVNICSKINYIAPLNSVAVGGDLYEVVKKFNEYKFKNFGQYSVGLKQPYPVYLLECAPSQCTT